MSKSNPKSKKASVRISKFLRRQLIRLSNASRSNPRRAALLVDAVVGAKPGELRRASLTMFDVDVLLR